MTGESIIFVYLSFSKKAWWEWTSHWKERHVGGYEDKDHNKFKSYGFTLQTRVLTKFFQGKS